MPQVRRTAAVVLITTICAAVCYAHGDKPHDLDELFSAWSFDPLVVICLLVSATLYTAGVTRLWSEAGIGSGVSRWPAASFAAGWFSLVVALISPVHAWGEVLFSAHMTQHEILMLVSAPLIVLGRPWIASMWAFPQKTRSKIGKLLNTTWLQHFWAAVTGALAAWAIHAAALWIWHVPFLFQATLENDFVHTLQHVSFFGSALLFWWAIIYGKRGLASYGAGVLYLFTTSIHSGVLGAFLTFTRKVWYPIYSDSTEQWGLTPLEDQQLGGLIMWVPAGLVYIAAALFMFAGWLRESEKRAFAPPQPAYARADSSDI
jgi:putative membrane protein